MTAEERLERDVLAIANRTWMGTLRPLDAQREILQLIALRERAAVRRARGKTLGTICVSKSGEFCGKRMHRADEKPWSVATYRVARVVTDLRKGGKRG